jgi:hypothetical protein
MRGKVCELQKQNALFEAQSRKGCKGSKKKAVMNLTGTELSLALKEDMIRTLGRKYMLTHCLWISAAIFPLTSNPKADLTSMECWISPLAMETAVKTEIFMFVPKDLHPSMIYENFGNYVSFTLF